jgi:O-antigen ligase
MLEKQIRIGFCLFACCLLALLCAFLLLRSVDMAVALAVIAVVFTLLFVEPFVGLICFVLFLFTRPQEFIPGLKGLPLMLIVGSAVFASIFVRQGLQARRAPVLLRLPQDYFLLWFFVAIVISHLAHLDVPSALSAVKEFAVVIVLYYLVRNLVISESRLRIFMTVLVLSCVLLAVTGLVQHFTGRPLKEYVDPNRLADVMNHGRVIALGATEDPNILGLTLLVVLPFQLLELRRSRSLLFRASLVVSIIVIVGTIYMTNSRGAMFGMGSLATYLVIRRYGMVRGLALGALIFVAMVVLGPSRMKELSPGEPSASLRISLWEAGLNSFRSHPLFGIGCYAWSKDTGIMIPHSAFIHCAAELGIFGLLPWVLLIYVAMKHTKHVAAHATGGPENHLGLYSDAIFCAFLAYVVTSVFQSVSYYYVLFMLIGLSGSVASVFEKSGGDSFRLFEKRDFLFSVLIAVVGLVFFSGFVRIFGGR